VARRNLETSCANGRVELPQHRMPHATSLYARLWDRQPEAELEADWRRIILDCILREIGKRSVNCIR
jgi:hypothetical protein